MTMPRYSLVNSSRMQPQHEVGLLVEQLRRLRRAGQRRDLLPLVPQPADVALELVAGRALGRGAHDEPGVGRADAVEHLAQALALVVGEALRDAVGVGLARHHHHEAAGEAHLLGEAGALVRDRVLGDLHDDHLAVLEQPLDLRLAAALDVGLVERDVAAVEHAVLGRADVDERRLHAGQHVLHLAEVDVAVDRLVAGGRRQRVLDQAAALEHRDVRVAALAARGRTSGSGRPAGPCGCGRGAVRARRRRGRPTASRRRRGRPARRRHDAGCGGPRAPATAPAGRGARRRRCRRCRTGAATPPSAATAATAPLGRRPARRSAASVAAPRRGAARRRRRCRGRRPGASHRSAASGAGTRVADARPGGCGSMPASSSATSATSSVGQATVGAGVGVVLRDGQPVVHVDRRCRSRRRRRRRRPRRGRRRHRRGRWRRRPVRCRACGGCGHHASRGGGGAWACRPRRGRRARRPPRFHLRPIRRPIRQIRPRPRRFGRRFGGQARRFGGRFGGQARRFGGRIGPRGCGIRWWGRSGAGAAGRARGCGRLRDRLVGHRFLLS